MITEPRPPELRVLLGEQSGVRFPLPVGRTLVGRNTELGISLEHSSVSREHAKLIRVGRQVLVTDLGSTNGTWINDHPVSGTRTVRDGDTLRFGHVALRLVAKPTDSGIADSAVIDHAVAEEAADNPAVDDDVSSFDDIDVTADGPPTESVRPGASYDSTDGAPQQPEI